MKVACNLYDRKLVNAAIMTRKAQAIAEEVNNRPLPKIPEYALRTIPDKRNSLLKRSFSYLPGDEAYPEVQHSCTVVLFDSHLLLANEPISLSFLCYYCRL